MGITISKSGTALWRNGLPARNVDVHILDHDPDNHDEDATITPGASGQDGFFVVNYDVERGEDWVTKTVGSWRLVDWNWQYVETTVNVRDITDTWSPYFQFKYRLFGKDFSHWAWTQPVLSSETYVLPHVGDAKQDGFAAVEFNRATSTTTVAMRRLHTDRISVSTHHAGSNEWTNWIEFPERMGQNVVLIRDTWGNLDLFAINQAGELVMKQQTGAIGNWGNWVSLGGSFPQDAPITIAMRQNNLEIFVGAMDHTIWHAVQAPNLSFGPFQQFGGLFTGSICVGANQDGRLELFANGDDGNVWHIWQGAPGTPAWSGWAPLSPGGSGIVPGPLAVGKYADGRVVVFALDVNGAVIFSCQPAPNSGPWSSWASLGGNFYGNFSLLPDLQGRLNLFAESRSGDAAPSIHRIQQDQSRAGGWGDWVDLGMLQDSPSSGSSAEDWPFCAGLMPGGRLFVLQGTAFRNSSDDFWYGFADGGLIEWRQLAPTPTPCSAPAVPTQISITPMDSLLRVAWAPSPTATDYIVNYGTDANFQPFTVSPGPNGATRVDIHPLSNTLPYFIKVAALSCDHSGWSAPASGIPTGSPTGIFNGRAIAHSESNTHPIYGREFTMDVTIQNNGSTPTGAFTVKLVDFDLAQFIGSALVASLAPFQSYTISFVVSVPLPPDPNAISSAGRPTKFVLGVGGDAPENSQMLGPEGWWVTLYTA